MTLSKSIHCSLKILLDAVRSIDSWLSLDFSHAAVIHCIHGDCSALVAACWLIYAGFFEDGLEALDFVNARRKVKMDVTLARYAQYFANLVAGNGIVPNPRALLLEKIVVQGVQNVSKSYRFHPGIEIFEQRKSIYRDVGAPLPSLSDERKKVNQSSNSPIMYEQGNTLVFDLSKPLTLSKEIQIKMSSYDETGGHLESFFQFSFHTGYMPGGIVRVAHTDMDWYSQPGDLGDFALELELGYDNCLGSEQDMSYSSFLDRNILKCLSRLVVHHSVKVNEILLTALVGIGHGRIVGMFSLSHMGLIISSLLCITAL